MGITAQVRGSADIRPLSMKVGQKGFCCKLIQLDGRRTQHGGKVLDLVVKPLLQVAARVFFHGCSGGESGILF
jgi:hypothetical protein